jgi:hypothetical protein
MSELEGLPPDLRALFADERQTYRDDAAARARVLRRIEASIAFGAVGVAATAAVAANTGLLASLSLHAAKHAKLWIALSLATGIVVGETHARLSPPPAPAPVAQALAPATAAVTAAPPTARASASSEPIAVPVSSLPAMPAPPVAPSVSAVPSAAPSNLAAEQAMIDTARSALSRGRAADALRAADDHARQFPRGRLAEERETMAIQALLLAGRRGDAEARAQRFHKAYPGSLYGNAVDALLVPREDGGR